LKAENKLGFIDRTLTKSKANANEEFSDFDVYMGDGQFNVVLMAT